MLDVPPHLAVASQSNLDLGNDDQDPQIPHEKREDERSNSLLPSIQDAQEESKSEQARQTYSNLSNNQIDLNSSPQMNNRGLLPQQRQSFTVSKPTLS